MRIDKILSYKESFMSNLYYLSVWLAMYYIKKIVFYIRSYKNDYFNM